MKRFLGYLVLGCFLLASSSCNIDEDITADLGKDEFYRARTAESKADWNKVYEYTPAPGQFINETKTGGFDGTQTTP